MDVLPVRMYAHSMYVSSTESPENELKMAVSHHVVWMLGTDPRSSA